MMNSFELEKNENEKITLLKMQKILNTKKRNRKQHN